MATGEWARTKTELFWHSQLSSYCTPVATGGMNMVRCIGRQVFWSDKTLRRCWLAGD